MRIGVRVRIRVRIDDSTVSGWGLFRKRSVVDVALHLERTNPAQPNKLLVTVEMTSPDHRAWRCTGERSMLKSHWAMP